MVTGIVVAAILWGLHKTTEWSMKGAAMTSFLCLYQLTMLQAHGKLFKAQLHRQA